MAEALQVEKPIVRDILVQPGAPALSATTDMPVVETKPDAVASPDQKAATDEVKTPVESATTDPKAPEKPSADDTPEPGEQPKKAQGVQKRLDELTKQREEANRRAEAADQRLDRALAALEKATGKPAEETKQQLATEDPEPIRPARSAYEDIEAYERDLDEYTGNKAAWVARKEVKAARAEYARELQEKAIADEQAKTRDTYLSRKAKAVEKHADFEEVANSPEVIVPGLVAQAIVHDEFGPELQYYFGKNPDEAKRLMALENPYLQLVELGTIKAKLSQPAGPTPAASISAAPPPIRAVRSAGAETTLPPTEQSAEEYAAMVRKREGWADPQKQRRAR